MSINEAIKKPVTPFVPVARYEQKKSRKNRRAGELRAIPGIDYSIQEVNLKKALDKYDLKKETRDSLKDEMVNIPGFDYLNSAILAAALVLILSTKIERTKMPTSDQFFDYINQAIEPILPDKSIPDRDILIERLKADVYRYVKHITQYRIERLKF